MHANLTHVYHITDIDNIPRIIKTGGLLSKSQIEQSKVAYEDIAYDGVQDRRSTTMVPCGPGGSLHDYVPFYFAHRSPMLFTIKQGNVAQHKKGQESIVYLVSSVEAIASNRKFVFTDGHGIMSITEFFENPSDLDKVDWKLMEDTYWSNTKDDGDRKRRRQAEFLVHNDCPWELIHTIGVFDSTRKNQVLEMIKSHSQQPDVKVLNSWYY